MRSLTLRHPHSFAICHCGKDLENRTWRPSPYRLAPGDLFAIHSGKAPPLAKDGKTFLQSGDEYIADICDSIRWMAGEGLVAGDSVITMRMVLEGASAIVAVAEYGGVVTKTDNPWFVGPVGWLLQNVRVLENPVPCRGAQGLWELPLDVEATVRGQL